MKQEDKELLIKDLCARLPYKVKCDVNGEVEILDSICDDDGYYFNFIGKDKEGYTLDEVKPYLLPMSSMTEEQNLEYLHTCFGGNASLPTLASFDYLLKNHFDYRGLIPMGLAIDATDKNIY